MLPNQAQQQPVKERLVQSTQFEQVVRQEAVPVRATLSCGWCGREIYRVEGSMEAARGRLQLASASSLFRLSAGWPRCLHCGGPLFVEDWKVIRPKRPPGSLEPDEERAA